MRLAPLGRPCRSGSAASLLFWSLLGACDSPPPLEHPPGQFGHETVLDGTLTGTDRVTDDRLGIPTDLIVLGGAIVVADAASVDRLHVFDARSGAARESLGPSGQGPGEFMGAPYLSIEPTIDPARFLAYDAAQSRFVSYSLREPGPVHESETLLPPLRTDRVIYKSLLTSDSTWVGLGFLEAGRVATGLLDGSGFRALGSSLSDRYEGSEIRLQQSHKAKLTARPPRNDRFVLATIRGSDLEILSSDGESLSLNSGPFPFEPDFRLDTRQGQPVWRAGPGNRYGYIDVVATESCIYGLFSGRSEEAFRADAWLAEFVYTLDWDGNLSAVHRLDHPALALAVDEKGGELFTASLSPEPRIRAYPLTWGC